MCNTNLKSKINTQIFNAQNRILVIYILMKKNEKTFKYFTNI